MSKNNPKNSNPCKVLSKYFSSSPVMDESLSEFKEKKSGCTGPKNSTKQGGIKERAKVKPKRIKGQKDIRTALKAKINELVTYTKEFDEVCRQSGVDIDSEQLQLAIALSKSVQETDTEGNNNESAPLTSKERTGKIRTTLQEYGFKVPEIKITKRKKKVKKNYKLLLSTDAEKQQIISNKYTQVVLENLCKSIVREEEVYNSPVGLYYLATSIPYREFQNNDILYVEDLIERSYSKGNLLRNWADIPGRPKSPETCKPLNMNFSEIECSQAELDIVLSGTLKSAKSTVQNKMKAFSAESPVILVEDETNIQVESANLTDDKKNKMSCVTLVANIEQGCSKDNFINRTNNSTTETSLATSSRIRSCSPDIFDDEGSLILDSSQSNYDKVTHRKNSSVVSPWTEKENVAEEAYTFSSKGLLDKTNNSIIDLIDDQDYGGSKDPKNIRKYTDIQNQDSNMDLKKISVEEMKYTREHSKKDIRNITKAQFSQGINYTQRNSNDFMEMTKCITVSSQLNHLQSSKSFPTTNKTKRISNDLMEITECVAGTSQTYPNFENNIDLSQKSDESITIKVASEIIDGFTPTVVDLSQSSHSEDELPFVEVMSESKNKSLDDTILLNSPEVTVNDLVDRHSNVKETLDLTQSPSSPIKELRNNDNKSASQSFYDDFDFNHSDDSENVSAAKSSLSDNISKANINPDNEEVDLTQSDSTNDSIKTTSLYRCSNQTSVDSNLGRKDEVSIDYDELFDNVTKDHTSTSLKINDMSHQTETCSVTVDSPQKQECCSHNSQVFDISDKELEYSVNQSRNDVAWDMNFGGISVMDNITGQESCTSLEMASVNSLKENKAMNRSLSDSYLPMVHIKINNVGQAITKTLDTGAKSADLMLGFSEEKGATPQKAVDRFVDTPSHEYIVKTDQVTPMSDYASMSTPQRNKELEKYGLKPFKRKRAIQLLTHLYNQTHPVVEGDHEDLLSPSKKPRHSSQPSPKKSTKSALNILTSPKKKLKSLSSYQKKTQSPSKDENAVPQGLNKENIYEVTCEFPIVKDIECSEEDWVFQKREKAKLHSCRVPLHIALHNYVSCRRKLRDAILKYEPVNIDVIHKELAAGGFRYDPKDLLKYMDRKCITVKTADNNSRNTKR